MNSGELAQVAGVTARALRHYHQIGILPEPDRGVNGYRDYGPEHLLRVLRITRAADAGVPLRRIGDVLDRPRSAATGDLVDDLEADLERRIALLQAQRDLVRQIRSGDFDPNLPSELAALLRPRDDDGTDPAMRDLDTDQAFLLLHLLGTQAMTYLTDAADLIERLGVATTVADLVSRFGQLSEEVLPEIEQQLVQDSITLLAPLIAESRRMKISPALAPSSLTLLEQHRNVRLNSAQRAVLDRLAEALRA